MRDPIVWTIAGSDASANAGIQADLTVFKNLGVQGCSVITAATAQNSYAVEQLNILSAEVIGAQIQSLKADFTPRAIKIGLMGQVDVISSFLANYKVLVVLDPLLKASSGNNLFHGDLNNYLAQLKSILSFVDILTPNCHEAEVISDIKINTTQDVENCARKILSLGAKSVLIKGGHFENKYFSQDYWSNDVESFWLSSQRYENLNYRGTGCVLSAAIAACLALGYSIKDALVIAKMYVNRGIRLAHKNHKNTATLYHNSWPEEQIDLPYLTHQPIHSLPKAFPACKLGLYPIVDNDIWVERLLEQGVKTLQLRVKNLSGQVLENMIQRSVVLSKKYSARLFVNDYWKYAMRFGAYGVHLGQEDINTAAINDLHLAGLCLGISTHCYSEVARAHAFNPSYLACGPIFPTTSKIMHFAPQGMNQLQRWRRTLKYPLVAIGGINLKRLSEIFSAEIEGAALISAITQADNPDAMTKKLLAIENYYAIYN